jgi:hypothetical protein
MQPAKSNKMKYIKELQHLSYPDIACKTIQQKIAADTSILVAWPTTLNTQGLDKSQTHNIASPCSLLIESATRFSSDARFAHTAVPVLAEASVWLSLCFEPMKTTTSAAVYALGKISDCVSKPDHPKYVLMAQATPHTPKC